MAPRNKVLSMGPSTSNTSGSSSPLSSPPRDLPSSPPARRTVPKSKSKSNGFIPPSRKIPNQPIKDALDHIPTSTINYSPKSFPAISHALFLSHLGTLQAEIWRLSQEVVDTDVAEADLGNQRQRIWNFAEAALGKLVVCVECDKIHPQSWLTKQAEDVKISMKEKIVTNLAVLDDLRSKLRKLEIDYIVMSHTAGDDGTGTRD